MNLKWIKRGLLAALLAWVVCGCKPAPLYYSAKAEVGKSETVIDQHEQRDYPPPAPVVTQSGPYVDTTRVSLIKPPSWYNKKVSLYGANLPFSFYVSQVMEDTNSRVHFDTTIDRKKLISVSYSGPAKGALAEIALRADYYYHYDNASNTVNWSAFETKVFDVSFMPGVAQYQVGNSAGATPSLAASSDSSGGSSGSSSSSSSSSSGSTGVDLTSDSQFSQLTGTISLWDDIEKTIKTLLSKEGLVTVSQATTTITVRDHPVNVAAVGRYLKKMNKELSKQVRLQVQVVEVQLSKDFAYGINWDVVRAFTNGSIALTSSTASNTSLSTLSPAGIFFAATGGSWTGTNTIVQALQQQGEVSIVTQPAMTTMNNQVAQIAIQDMQNYISSISSGTASGGTGGTSVSLTSSSPTVSTSTLTTGVNLYLLPKVEGNKVFLQLSTTLSDLVSLDKINTSTGDVTPTTGSSSPATPGTSSGSSSTTPTAQTTPAFVQLPKINARTMNQRAVIPSGATLVLAGFKQVINKDTEGKLFNSTTLGGQSAEATTVELILLITPTILSLDEDLEVEG